MSIGIVDTTVIVHYFRNYSLARAWLDQHTLPLSVVSVTWLEVMEGATNKGNQLQSKAVLEKFELLHLTVNDQIWAMQQLEKFQFSHHIGKEDCLIAAVAHRLQIPLYTHNLKDMMPLIGSLAHKPY